MARFEIHRAVDRERLHTVVPPRLRVALPSMSVVPERLALVVFGSDERDVVTLRQAEKALWRLGPDASAALVLAMGMTDEADAALRRAGVIVARVGGYSWTEESYHRRD
jgi:hypothetical protein